MIYNYEEFYRYHKDFILNDRYFNLLRKYGFPVNVSFTKWEVGGAILASKNKAKDGFADLENLEIKSLMKGGVVKFDFHPKSGLKKLDELLNFNYIIFSYDNEYQNLDVYSINGTTLVLPYYDNWKTAINEKFEANGGRKQLDIPSKYVEECGELIMKIENRKLVFPINIDLQPQRNMVWIRMALSLKTQPKWMLSPLHS